MLVGGVALMKGCSVLVHCSLSVVVAVRKSSKLGGVGLQGNYMLHTAVGSACYFVSGRQESQSCPFFCSAVLGVTLSSKGLGYGYTGGAVVIGG